MQLTSTCCFLLALLPALASAHGYLCTPPPRGIEKEASQVDALKSPNTQGICRGEPEGQITQVNAGAPLTLDFKITAPHVGPCVVYLLDEQLGNPVEIASKMDCAAPGKVEPWTVTIPEGVSGRKVLRWTWEGRHVSPSEPYEQCVDLKIGGGGGYGQQPPSTSFKVRMGKSPRARANRPPKAPANRPPRARALSHPRPAPKAMPFYEESEAEEDLDTPVYAAEPTVIEGGYDESAGDYDAADYDTSDHEDADYEDADYEDADYEDNSSYGGADEDMFYDDDEAEAYPTADVAYDDTSSDAGGCTQGQYVCREEGGFSICNNNQWVHQDCGAGQMCVPSNGSILCTLASQAPAY